MSRLKEFCEGIAAGGEVRHAAGVYVIVNTVTVRAYVGQSSNIALRCATHRAMLRAGKHHNSALQADWTIYGEACFIFAPFAYVDEPLALERELIEESYGIYNRDVAKPSDRGQGRKPLAPDEASVVYALRVSQAQRAKIEALGGQAALRKLIDRAKVKA